MATNTNSKTGLGYGVINANNVSMEALDVGGAGWVNVDELNYYDEVEKKLVAWLNREDFGPYAAARAVDMGQNDEFATELESVHDHGPAHGDEFTQADISDNDNLMQCVYDSTTYDGNCTWEFSGDEYHLLYDSNENVLWVMASPYKALVRPTFQGCYPNCGDLDRGDEDYGYEYHALGLEYFDEYSPCPYVPVPIGKEEYSI